jgi:phage baseplate assembly protein W
MPHLIQVEPRSPYRLRVVWDLPATGQDTAADYALARADGAGPGPEVAAAWSVDAGAVELALASPLPPGLALVLVHAAGDRLPCALPPTALRPDDAAGDGVGDPEAELFGVDLDWLAPALAAGGDVPEVRGLAALRADLAAIAVTAPGELFHRPTEGAALPQRVNGAGAPAELGRLAAAVRRAWVSDDRVKAARVSVVARADGAVTAAGDVETVPLPGERLDLVVRR